MVQVPRDVRVVAVDGYAVLSMDEVLVNVSVGERRRALVIGVGRFDPAPLIGEPGLRADGFDNLDFAVGCASDVVDALSAYRVGGFDVTFMTDPDRDEIAAAVRALLDDESPTARIVHVISHGRPSSQADQVEVVGRCRRRGNSVRNWVAEAQDGGVPTLFLVDLCGAGRAVNLNFVEEPDAGERVAWVIGAALGSENAYDGAFSAAVARMLGDCARDGLGVDARHRYVPLREFARRISDDLRRQRVSSTSVPFHLEPDLPFLPNPLWTSEPDGASALAAPMADLDASLRPFLADAVADFGHFQERAGAHFSGRQALLNELVPWVDGTGDGGIWVVTGAAGAGKSALLGALVCAAHPQLAPLVPHVRTLLDDPPQLNPHLAAVHARQRSLDEIVSSVASQLELASPDRPTAAWLVGAIADMNVPPVLVVDALDECPVASAVQTVLLQPLGYARRRDGSAAARVLVGTRPWNQFASLRRDTAVRGRLTDLDQVDPKQLRIDLRRFLLRIFDDAWYAETLASAIAARLAHDHAARMAEPGSERWGQFLVASRYAQYVQMRPPQQPSDVDELVARVPTELPQVLELELRLEEPFRTTSMRTALAALAFAKGDGMPVELLRVVARAIGRCDDEEFLGRHIRTYLRHSEDQNGVSLLRLYHQGLADYLQTYPTSSRTKQDLAAEVFAVLHQTRRDSAHESSWAHAPAYLHRYAIQHAADVDAVDALLSDMQFLVHADPSSLLPELDGANTAPGRLGAAIYRSVHHLLSPDPEQRRRLLTLAALRYGTTPDFRTSHR